MRKIIFLATTMFCSATFAGDVSVINTKGVDNAIDEILLTEFNQGENPKTADSLNAGWVQVDSNSVISTPKQFISLLTEGDFSKIEPHLDYIRMQRAYLTQMMYVSGRIDALTEYVEEVASGTFETKIREGSMLLGLVGNQLTEVIARTKTNPDDFKKFMGLKFAALSMPDVKISYEVISDLLLIEARSPYSETSDMIALKQSKEGLYKVVAFIPKEVEDTNAIIGKLMSRAKGAEMLTEKLEEAELQERNKRIELLIKTSGSKTAKIKV